MDPAILCKLFFTLGAAVSVGGTLVPSFRESIMNYGPRKTRDPQGMKDSDIDSNIRKLFNLVASIQVPHTWFTHYYVISLASSIFWGYQILQHGKIIQVLASFSTSSTSSMTINQVFLAWTLMAAQGGRRLYESLTLTKPSQSRMWIGLWIIGMLYYVFIGIGIWIEGIPALSQNDSLSKLQFSRPSIKTSVAMAMFWLASMAQNVCHKHLASLKKYSLPDHAFFRSLICPHYACECLIYLAIAIQSAPAKNCLNGTVLAGLVFVASNLAVTADSTRKWYAEKFGEDAIKGRWKMVPYVF